ncbi:MAG: gamma carbonic anhydrase family protein [Alphaproteobacteria bacterium]|nr:gamma carbonic anhydrase family protein [Alphaproteobacteria bacterium]
MTENLALQRMAHPGGLILSHKGRMPRIAHDAYIAPNATIIGDVEIGSQSSIWFGCVVRGDVNMIRIGERSNIQDGTIVHVDSRRYGTFVGDDVLIGHGAIIHACMIEDHAVIGIRATVLDGAVVERGAMVAACALVTPGRVVKQGELWAGSPARKVRDISPDEADDLADLTAGYVDLARAYSDVGMR